jgi:hypothetical protein
MSQNGRNAGRDALFSLVLDGEIHMQGVAKRSSAMTSARCYLSAISQPAAQSVSQTY